MSEHTFGRPNYPGEGIDQMQAQYERDKHGVEVERLLDTVIDALASLSPTERAKRFERFREVVERRFPSLLDRE